ncbi:MAG: glycosyltransferase family 2 protein [Xanthomonadaceae bacterium]|jgi:glycosyltransferase involved in cell wall biosynthesis|nr:glycosyltransferase family 2 protein [Xanthomonadaceae bacterium]
MNDIPLSGDNIAVVIPALNEALRIREVVEAALAYGAHIIVIDDGSDDDTAEVIADLPVTVLRHGQRRGKGAALRTGFAEAGRRGLRGVVTMDGDGQHAAADIPRLLRAANSYPAHIVIGARLRKRAQQPAYRRLANEFGDWGIAWGTGQRITDTQSGQRYYPIEVASLENVPGENFVLEAQLLISAARDLGIRCVSVPVESRYRDADGMPLRKSHFHPLRDLYRITAHVVMQVLRHDNMWQQYRLARENPPLIYDPSGEHIVPTVVVPIPNAAAHR